jgi:hypothetical protein
MKGTSTTRMVSTSIATVCLSACKNASGQYNRIQPPTWCGQADHSTGHCHGKGNAAHPICFGQHGGMQPHTIPCLTKGFDTSV